MNTTSLLLVAQRTDNGLTLAEVLESLPADPTSLFALVLIVGFFGAMVYFGTRSESAGRPRTPEGGAITNVSAPGGETFPEEKS